MTTKVPIELSSTPSISDGGNATAISIDSSENSTFSGDVTITSSTSNKPELKITNTNADANPSYLKFIKDSASPADNDELGRIYMYGDDDAGNSTEAVLIRGIMTDVSNGSEDSTLEFFTQKAGSQTSTLTLASGNVGIGTAPSTDLHISGANDNTNGQLKITGTSGGDAQIAFTTDTNGRGMYLDDSDTNAFKIYGGAGKGSNEFVISNSGAVTTAGSLTVNDYINSTDLAGSGFRNVNSTAAGNLTNSTSLRELKENIVDMSLGLSDVLKLKPREFDWKDAVEYGTQDIGFVADEVFDVSPKLATYKVGDKTKDNLQGVKYDTMTSLLTKAIQELSAKNDALEARIKTLEDA